MTPRFLFAAVLATSSFVLPAAAQPAPREASCSGLIYYDAKDNRVCVTADSASAMSLADLNAVIAEIERTTLKIAAINLDSARTFADENDTRAQTLSNSLFRGKKPVTFGGDAGGNLNSAVGDIARIVSTNSAIEAKRSALAQLSKRLLTFMHTDKFTP